jgi:hypothetical protein
MAWHRLSSACAQGTSSLGSRFKPRGGYFTADNVCIARTMWMRVMEIQNDCATELVEPKDRLAAGSGEPRAKVFPLNHPVPIIPEQYLEEPFESRAQLLTLQSRAPTSYAENCSVWKPPLNTSDPNCSRIDPSACPTSIS